MTLIAPSSGTTPLRTAEERRWLTGIEDATFGVWDLDPRLETVHYSPQWKVRLGFPQIHSPDSTSFWRGRVHPDDFAPMLDALRAHLDGFAPSYEMQFRLRCNGSGYRTVLSRGRVVARDADGNATRMVGTMVDLSGHLLARRSNGLATEVPAQRIVASRAPLHTVLGAGDPGPLLVVPTPDALHLVDSVADLLDMALHAASRTAR